MMDRLSAGEQIIHNWLKGQNKKAFTFQTETWKAIQNEESGLVNAPTGFGKTFAVFLGAVIRFINKYPDSYQQQKHTGLQLIWVTPLRALAKDIQRAMQEVVVELNMPWEIGMRSGDTPPAERQRQKKRMPEVLLITPESLHILMAQKEYPKVFADLQVIAIDEWHELLGSKRGVQTELAISRLVHIRKVLGKALQLWGISATIGNLEEAADVLLAPLQQKKQRIIRAKLKKNTLIESIFPDEIEKYPWAGHLGLRLVDKVLPIIANSKTTLIFINTRGMSERWYHAILNAAPELAGSIALHHGSIEPELRIWVEDALHSGKLKAVVCTASLDLGVDFRPVETVIQVGSPKGVARFLQRAGRSGHSPDEVSHIYFLPTHSLELMEVAALRDATNSQSIESRDPLLRCFDVLIQYLCTLAVSDGFTEEILPEIRSTFCFASITDEEWQQVLNFITTGGNALQQYDEFKKVEYVDGVYRITDRRIAMRHRLHIGTIVSDAMMKVRFVSGGFVGMIEEWFISRLDPGTVFSLAGRHLELVMIKDMTAIVRRSDAKKAIVPSWTGGRMPLSANLGQHLRAQYNKALAPGTSKEIRILRPLFKLQQELSYVPSANELLIEQIETKDGYHLFVYPFEGRLVHEAMAAILAHRISQLQPMTFSLAMNDYGFELLSDKPIPVDDSNVYELFSEENLTQDIYRSANATEMAKRKFRDIAVIGGLVFQGLPGKYLKTRHLQSSASLLFSVFQDYDSSNILLRQAYQEVLEQQMEEVRLRNMLKRIQQSTIVLSFPTQFTPLCFPIMVDSLRETLTSEKLEDRIRKMQIQLEK